MVDDRIAAAAPGAPVPAAGGIGGLFDALLPVALPSWLRSTLKAIIIYTLFNAVVGMFFSSSSSSSGLSGMGGLQEAFRSLSGAPNSSRPFIEAPAVVGRCMWPLGRSLHLRVYMHDSNDVDVNELELHSSPVWEEKGLVFRDDPKNSRSWTFVPLEDQKRLITRENGTLYLHAVLSWSSTSSSTSAYSTHMHQSFPILRYRPRPKEDTTKNLLFGSEDQSEQEHQGQESVVGSSSSLGSEIVENQNDSNASTNSTGYIPFWYPEIDLQLVGELIPLKLNQLPQAALEKVSFLPSGQYYPIFFHNDFWVLSEHLIQVNETSIESLNTTVRFSTTTLTKFIFTSQMEESLRLQESMAALHESDRDEFKRMLLETNPYLLGITAIVTILHLIFDVLAFKNDIQFWKNRESLRGLSTRTVLMNAISHLIIFLYLLDNETSLLILISSGVGVAIDFWKITKCVDISFSRSWPFIQISAKPHDEDDDTQKFDEEAMRTLLYVLLVLLIGYAGYSLIYKRHKSWYSFILETFVGAIYTFGFVMMTPQIWINYRTKSVAHLPWRSLVYKSINTFIDDLFAFIIKMPTLHRLSCFRDDIVFFILMYQRWIYPVDPRRMNEFGQKADDSSAESCNLDSEPQSQVALNASTSSNRQEEHQQVLNSSSNESPSETTGSVLRKRENVPRIVPHNDHSQAE